MRIPARGEGLTSMGLEGQSQENTASGKKWVKKEGKGTF